MEDHRGISAEDWISLGLEKSFSNTIFAQYPHMLRLWLIQPRACYKILACYGPANYDVQTVGYFDRLDDAKTAVTYLVLHGAVLRETV
jgi:hypothetical protein